MSKGVAFGRASLTTFRFAVKGDTLTLSELGPAQNNDARGLIEGEYKAAKKK